MAGTTLQDLLDEPSLRLSAVDGKDRGLCATVRWAQPTELPDPSPYLRGGELVCSVGTTLTDPPRCEAFVRALTRAHAAGLCFGVGDVHDVVPPALVEACREHGVPLLIAPLGARFSAISEYLAERRVDFPDHGDAGMRRCSSCACWRGCARTRRCRRSWTAPLSSWAAGSS